ncbi:YbaB/EbfC family nucleoid-associated protein [Tuberibacillus sp. Marseille-P3662]|uniref:YbaB/EbfC family nucleoid-associated protein n=1 Tax=Tuberibacillus sp. Marseille-P3662 TaxID=1965358 RepID=UPI000A1CA27F|nr:YbaB/EbfC family nucleoid-associated protein [Tuberibacillus sp. Marseille-P3662]
MRGGNMNNMAKQMQKMQKKMEKAQEELKDETVEGSAGGGVVTVQANGHKEVTNITIKEEAVDPDDVDMLQDLVLTAVNEALKSADELSNERMGQFTKGLNIPGF